MSPHSEITDDTRFVQMNVSTIQAMIKYNKKQINNLETEKKYLQYLIAEKYFPNADPNDSSAVSEKSFIMLNLAKDDVRAIQRNINLLATINYCLKRSI